MSNPGPGDAQQQTAQVRVRVQEAHMASSYANAFRTHRSPEEVVVDFGLRLLQPLPPGSQTPEKGPKTVAEMNFDVTSRVVMNYHTAKRLVGALQQVIKQHEEQFGEIKVAPQSTLHG
jgi:hypothetical protein